MSLRVTAVRVAAFEAVVAHPHGEVEVVIGAVGDELGGVSRQAVYDALHALVRAGLARRIEPAGSPARYEARVGDNHHHAVCRRCGSVADVDCAVGVAPCLEPSETHGFALDEAEVTYWGLCPACGDGLPVGTPPGEPDASAREPDRRPDRPRQGRRREEGRRA
ncbi:MAG: Fur family transcriptional regulator [Acidimicrobiales bacterium]